MGTVSNSHEPQRDGEAPEKSDFANYFCTYAFLYHQKDMLEDQKRTGSYYDAVMRNQNLFKDSVVLDVGAGTGILALFAAKAGAKKVYAVEATAMAQHAKTLVHANNMSDTVVVIQGTMETVELPEKVDIIISEWMGYFLLRESMLDSVIVARDKYLKSGGSLFPSHARMYLAPIRSHGPHGRMHEYEGEMSGWRAFVNEMDQFYDINMSCLTKEFEKEQRDYYKSTAQWSEVHPHQLLSAPVCFKTYDLLTVTLEELQAPLEADLNFEVQYSSVIDALCGFFDVSFAGSPENPARHPVTLSTAPEHGPCTHWGQLSFYLIPQIPCERGDSIPLSFKMTRREDNHRLLNVRMEFKNSSDASGRQYDFFIE